MSHSVSKSQLFLLGTVLSQIRRRLEIPVRERTRFRCTDLFRFATAAKWTDELNM